MQTHESPEAVRRAKVRGGISTRSAISLTEMPLSEERNSSARKARPLRSSRMRWGVEVAARPRLEPAALLLGELAVAEVPCLRAKRLSIELD